MIFDIKLGDNFRRKEPIIGGGQTATAPSLIKLLSIVSRDSVRMALTIASLNSLDVLACNIQKAYLKSICR